MTGIRALVEHLLPRGGRVVIPSPVYPPFAIFSRELGREVVQVPLTESGRLDLPAIDDALAGHHLAPGTSGEPGPWPAVLTGRPRREPMRARSCSCAARTTRRASSTPRAELRAVAEAADRHRATVIVDEVHAPLVTRGATFVPWLEVSQAGFAVTSAAKSFNLAGLKAGLILAGRSSRATLQRLPESLPYGASHLGVVGHAAAYRSDPGWLDAVNRQHRRERRRTGRAARPRPARRSGTARRRRPTSRGWTAGPWGSATTRPRPSSRAAGSRSPPDRPSDPAAPGTPGSTSRAPGRCSTEAVERMARTVHPAG